MQYGKWVRKGESECREAVAVASVRAPSIRSWAVAVEDERSQKNSQTAWALELGGPGAGWKWVVHPEGHLKMPGLLDRGVIHQDRDRPSRVAVGMRTRGDAVKTLSFHLTGPAGHQRWRRVPQAGQELSS